MNAEPLSTQTNRAKARWLRSVMYNSAATSTQKCLAYAIADHLNCVTLDCWPAQPTFMRLLGRKSIKTVQRAARGLEALELITMRRGNRAKSGYRYAPVFLAVDKDKRVAKNGQRCPDLVDTNVDQSFLQIRSESSSTADAAERSTTGRPAQPAYNRAKRGVIEPKIAALLGGISILERIATIDDAVVDRLCRAYIEGSLGERELTAARLAAEQER